MFHGPLKTGMLKTTALLLSLLTCANGCFWAPEPYTPVNYYDLGAPPALNVEGVDLKSNTFGMESPVKYKMVYRMENCKAFVDDYNKWVQPPPNMLARYVQLAFSSDKDESGSDDAKFVLDASIISFDIDLPSKTATLAVDYTLSSPSGGPALTKSRVFRKNFEGSDPASYAQAMSKAAAQFVLELKTDILSLKKKLADQTKDKDSNDKKADKKDAPKKSGQN